MIYSVFPLYLLVLSITIVPSVALPDLGVRNWRLGLPALWALYPTQVEKRTTDSKINHNPDGSPFLWVPQDEYSGKTFFDRFDFFNDPDLTSGTVTYVNRTTAINSGLIYTQDDGTVIMKADDYTALPMGVNRSSVRISTQTLYTTGLFLLDLNKAPWGCAIWPAFWTTGPVAWPANGEIDVLEGVHDNEHNQITFHTKPGCSLDANATFTGTVAVAANGLKSTNCDTSITGNHGCATIEWSRASYGPYFEAQGGGILAMKWDENDISIWSFYRAAIPTDVAAGTPNPSLWGPPSARLMNTLCNIPNFFVNHTIVFDITFCGSWAGNTYATTDCPGTCPERLMNPANFVNATWSINSLKVYRKQLFTVNSTSAALQGPILAVSRTETVLPIVAAMIYNLW